MSVLTFENGDPLWTDQEVHDYKDTLVYELKRILEGMNDFSMNNNTHSLKHGKILQMKEVIAYIEHNTI